MINTAVILAAGLGSRIRECAGKLPKGLLMMDEKTMIERSISILIEEGFTKIYIGTGYKKEEYEKLALKYSQITCVYNPKYETTGSLFTLFQFKDYIKEDFVLLESDLVYERAAVKIIKESEKPDVILASKLTNNGDEVYIEADENHFLVNMSKKREKLKSIYAELVGITKLSYSTFQKICAKIEKLFPTSLGLDYEDGLVGISEDVDLYINKLDDFVWCEVDDEQHWTRAINTIYPMILAKESVPIPIKRNILLNPGPATTTDTVKYAQVVPDICPREKEFGQVMEFISTELTKFVANPKEYTTVLFGGSGTAAVESIFSSVIDQEAVLIINNGAYGKRMVEIAEVHRLNFLEYHSEVDEAIDLDNLENFIQNASEKIRYLAVVHCETTTGLLNNIEAIGQLCKKYRILMIVDAMSSYAGVPIKMKDMNICYLAASSNKNLQGTAGVSFVIAESEQLEKSREIKPRNFYLHLYEQYNHFKMTKQMRFTPPVQTLYALKQAIIETQWEGIQNRYNRYTRSWETLIQGLTSLGLNYLVNKSNHSKLITSVVEPSHPNYDFIKMYDFFYHKGFTIYPGKLDQKSTFRVANIGNITYKDMEVFSNLLGQYLNGLKGGE
jgi:2-aminoethylphosphonate-pyruvate transaminase